MGRLVRALSSIVQFVLAAALAAALGGRPALAAPPDVDLELVLAVDVSRSMDYDEQRLQRDGYVAAFRHPEVIAAISSGALGRIAVTYVEWAGPFYQTIVVPWTILANGADAEAFATKLAAAPLMNETGTSISGGLSFSAQLFDTSGARGLRRAIDVSGDGPNNMGLPVAPMRDQLVEEGITINGLPIMLKRSYSFGPFNIPNLDVYYEDCVIGGPGAFMITDRRHRPLRGRHPAQARPRDRRPAAARDPRRRYAPPAAHRLHDRRKVPRPLVHARPEVRGGRRGEGGAGCRVGKGAQRRAHADGRAPRGHASLCPPYNAHQNKSYPRPQNRSYTPRRPRSLRVAFRRRSLGGAGSGVLASVSQAGRLEARNPPAGESRPPTPCARPRVRERTCPPTAFLPELGTGNEAGFRVLWPGTAAARCAARSRVRVWDGKAQNRRGGRFDERPYSDYPTGVHRAPATPRVSRGRRMRGTTT